MLQTPAPQHPDDQLIRAVRQQFDLVWKLAQHHLPHLTDELCYWEPAELSWNVRRTETRTWTPDWAETEPNPVPAPTVSWLCWHIMWWWSSLIAVMDDKPPLAHDEVLWPGSAEKAVQKLQSLADEWQDRLRTLTDEDLAKPLSYPWPEPRPLSSALLWMNSELMKNISEIGSLRILFHAGKRQE